jgi:hypothetical protein
VSVRLSRYARNTILNFISKDISFILNLIITKRKTISKIVWNVCLMAKSGLEIMVSLYLSLSHKHGGGDKAQTTT